MYSIRECSSSSVQELTCTGTSRSVRSFGVKLRLSCLGGNLDLFISLGFLHLGVTHSLEGCMGVRVDVSPAGESLACRLGLLLENIAVNREERYCQTEGTASLVLV